MHLSAIIPCVDYAHWLAPSLDLWREGCDQLLVVTTPRDTDTIELCAKHDVRWLTTDAFYTNGAHFNKARALSQGLLNVPLDDWILLLDADVVPPQDWRRIVEAAKPEPGNLYGARRQLDDQSVHPEREIAGYFMLFHGSDPVLGSGPGGWLGSWKHAGSYDSAFQSKWKPERRIKLPLVLRHQGEHGKNWCGVGKDREMQEVLAERKRRGGWKHEAI